MSKPCKVNSLWQLNAAKTQSAQKSRRTCSTQDEKPWQANHCKTDPHTSADALLTTTNCRIYCCTLGTWWFLSLDGPVSRANHAQHIIPQPLPPLLLYCLRHLFLCLLFIVDAALRIVVVLQTIRFRPCIHMSSAKRRRVQVDFDTRNIDAYAVGSHCARWLLTCTLERVSCAMIDAALQHIKFLQQAFRDTCMLWIEGISSVVWHDAHTHI